MRSGGAASLRPMRSTLRLKSTMENESGGPERVLEVSTKGVST